MLFLMSTCPWPRCLLVSLSSPSLCLHLFRMDLPSSGPQDITLRNPQPCEWHSSLALLQLPSPLLPLSKVMRVIFCSCYLLLTSLPFSPPSLQGILLLQLRSHHNQTPAAEAERGQGSYCGLGKWWGAGARVSLQKAPIPPCPLFLRCPSWSWA